MILAIVTSKQLKIRQMDIKGAYLNGNLQEYVYMLQPEGYNDGSDKVCLLIKTLYGLKQSGHKWNKELDKQLKGIGSTNLWSDLCAYTVYGTEEGLKIFKRDHRLWNHMLKR